VGTIPSLRVVAAGSAWPRGEDPTFTQDWLDVDGRLVARGASHGGRWVMDWPGLGTYLFGPFGDVEVFPCPGADSGALHDSFIRGVLPVVQVAREHEALHGSAIAVDGRVYAFLANSGTGKSSLAFGIASRVGSHWADDTVLLSREAGPPRSLCLPFPPRVDEEVRRALGVHSGDVPRIAHGVTQPIARVYLLRRDSSLDPVHPVISAMPPAALFEGVLANAHPLDMGGPPRRRRMIERLLAFTAGVRGWEIRFAPSLEALPLLVDTVQRHLDEG